MKPTRSQQPSSSHFLAILTGCVLMLACATGEAHAATSGGLDHKQTTLLIRSLNGETQNTFRKIRHLLNLFIDQEQAGQQQAQVPDLSFVPQPPASAYRCVYGYHVKHLRHREIRTWQLRE